MQIEILLGIREYEIDGGVVQLVRIHACHAWGREFEPRRSRQLKKRSQEAAFFCMARKTCLNLRPRLELATPVASNTRTKLTDVSLAEVLERLS